jgi:hypothetical protein
LREGAHAGHSRTDVQGGAQIAQLGSGAYREHFHAAIGEIAGPAGETQVQRPILDKVAEANALHSAADKPTLGRLGIHIRQFAKLKDNYGISGSSPAPPALF